MDVILCVAPNPSIDKLFEVDQLDPGGIHRPTAFVPVAGGKGLNVARSAATLGADVHVAALLGGHAGRWVAEQLDGSEIPLSAVWCDGETRSCLSVADRATHSLTEFYEDGTAVGADAWREFVGVVHELAAEAAWTTVSGSLPPEAPEDGVEQLVTGADVAADTRQLGNARPSLVKANLAEAAQLTGLAVDSRLAVVAAARALRERIGGDGRAAVVTRGRHGAVLVDPEGTSWDGSLEEIGRYPVGSGDAFLAGLVVALERGDTWPDALRLALGAGAANAEISGAGRLERLRAEALAVRAVVAAL